MPAPGKRGHISNRDGAAPFRSRPAGVSDSKVVHWLRRLDQKLPELETSIDSLIAAHLRVNPDLSDDDIVRRIRGLDNPARVAKVRGLLAAGRGAPTPKASESLSRSSVRSGQQLADLAALMPSFTVTAADGTVHRAATYGEARCLRARTGGTVAVER